MTNHVDALLSRFAYALSSGGVPPDDAEHIADVVLAMPNESRADRLAQMSAWMAALDQLAAARCFSLIPSTPQGEATR